MSSRQVFSKPAPLATMGARAADGVSRLAPYHHFDGKGDLLARVAEHGYRELVASIHDALAAADASFATLADAVAQRFSPLFAT